MYSFLRYTRLLALVIGVTAIFAADRYFMMEGFYTGLRSLGYAGIFLSLLMTYSLSALQKRTFERESRCWRLLTRWIIAVVVGLVVYSYYLGTLDAAKPILSNEQKILLALWATLVIGGLLVGIGMEWAMIRIGRGKTADPLGLVRGGQQWLKIAMLLAILANLNYVSSRLNIACDWSYLRTTEPSAATRSLLQTLPEGVEIALVYPENNEVAEMIAPFFDRIKAMQPNINIQRFDYLLSRQQAKHFNIARNGAIVFRYDDRTREIDTGEKMENARRLLDRLDMEFQRRLKEVLEKQKEFFFSVGHSELSGEKNKNQQLSISLFSRYLKKQNFAQIAFGLRNGSAMEVPPKVDLYAIIGPTRPFLQAEVDVIRRYVERGGDLLIFLDLERAPASAVAEEWPLYDLLKEWGLEYRREPLVDLVDHGVLTRTKFDYWFIRTDNVSSHMTTAGVSLLGDQGVLSAIRSGHWVIDEGAAGWKSSVTVRSAGKTFVDVNQNGRLDQGEPKEPAILGVVAERKVSEEELAKEDRDEKWDDVSRIVLFSDATAASDLLFRNAANALFIGDSIKWALGKEDLVGAQSSEEDVPVRHTRKEDAVIFNGSVAAVPALLLFIGFLLVRRPSTRKRGGSNAT